MALTPEQEARFQELNNQLGYDSGGTTKTYEKRKLVDALKQEVWPDKPGIEGLAASTPVQVVLGYGDALSNALAAGVSTLSGGTMEYNPIQSGGGMAYDVGHFAGEVTPYLIPGGFQARMATTTGIGALTNPENPMQGAVEGAAFGLGGEALAPIAKGIGKGIGKGVGYFTGEAAEQAIAKGAKENYQAGKESAVAHIKPFFDEIGEKSIAKASPKGRIWPTSMKQINESFAHNESLIQPKSKEIYELFKADPTVNNAFSLSKQLKADGRAIKGTDEVAIKQKDLYKKMSEKLEDVMAAEASDPKAFKQAMKSFNTEYARGPAIYKDDKILRAIAAGSPVDNAKLVKAIEKGLVPNIDTGLTRIPAEHYLAQALKDAEKSLGVSGFSNFPSWLPGLNKYQRKLIASGTSAAGTTIDPYAKLLLRMQGQGEI